MANLKNSPIDVAHQLLYSKLCLDEQIELLEQLTLDNIQAEDLAFIVHDVFQSSFRLKNSPYPLIDIVGTGGDGQNTFNISTTASFVVAAAGYNVAKHGNRAVTSRSGSFDCLEALDIQIPVDAKQAADQLTKHQLCFLFAPYFHPQFKKIAKARQALAKKGEKSIFNILGPLLNPSKLSHIVIGVYDKVLIKPMVQACLLLNFEKALVIHGNGSDEASIEGITHCARLENSRINYYELNAANYSLSGKQKDLIGGDADENAKITQGILDNQITGSPQKAVIFNAALAMELIDDALSLENAIIKAQSTITEGIAARKLQRLQGK